MAVDTEPSQASTPDDATGADGEIEGGLELSWLTRRQTRLKIPKPRVLEVVPGESDVAEEDPGNLIIEGDNRQAMVSLLPQYANSIDVVLIDPPYNTGKNDFRYSDARFADPDSDLNTGEFVSAEDGGRHRKWLRQMAPTLRIIKDLMAPSGVIFIHINDIELGRLLLLMEDIFKEHNRLGVLVWKSATDNNPTHVLIEHEYIVCWARDKAHLGPVWRGPITELKRMMLEKHAELKKSSQDLAADWKTWVRSVKSELTGGLSLYELADDLSPYRGDNLANPGVDGYHYDVLHPATGKPCREPLRGWRFPQAGMERLIAAGRILFGTDHTTIPQYKRYMNDSDDEQLRSVITEFGGKAVNADVRRLFRDQPEVFPSPKPVGLEEYLLTFAAPKDGIVLDAFAGSGTTAHAVMRLNKRDHGTRRFILIEEGNEGDRYATGLTAERLRRARSMEKLPGGFSFYRVGPKINLDAFEQLQREQLITMILQTDASGRGGGIKRVEGKWVIGYNAKREAICLHFDAKEHSPLTADILREMYEEASELNLQRPLRVYSERTEIFGSESFKFFKLPDEVTSNLSIALKGF